MSDMEWIPARLRVVHADPSTVDPKVLKLIQSSVVRVKPFKPSDRELSHSRAEDCDCTRNQFWIIHPDDFKPNGELNIYRLACSHEVLTD